MRKTYIEPIRQALDEIDKGQKSKAREFQQLELMRDRLVEGDDAVFGEIINRFPEADIQKLRQLVRATRKGKKDNSPPRQSRVLFRYLHSLALKKVEPDYTPDQEQK